MASQQQVTQQYKIANAIIRADRLGEQEFDVSQQISELVIYEDIEKPYLTGKIVLLDDANLFDTHDFRGSETITIRLASVDYEGVIDTSRTFIMHKIDAVVDNNDRSKVYLFSLIDVHGMINYATNISKSYRGKIEDIITGIITSELGVQVDRSYLSPSFQAPIKVIVPNLHPLQACDWLRDRATSDSGAPFFVYASLHDDNIRIGNTDVLLSQPPYNRRQAFIYSKALANSTVDMDDVQRAFVIEKYDITNAYDTIAMANAGALGQSTAYSDLHGRSQGARFDINTTIKKLRDNGILDPDQKHTIFDPEQLVGDQLINERIARVVHTAHFSQAYQGYNSYHDVQSPQEADKRASNAAFRTVLYNNMITITVPGTSFLLGKATVGDMMRVHFQHSNVRDDEINSESILDKNKSGDYLIYRIAHTFVNTKHTATVDITKVAKQFTKPI